MGWALTEPNLNRYDALRASGEAMRRREFFAFLGGAAGWPLTARAQPGERMRRIGVLLNVTADDPESPARLTALAQGLQELGWIDGRNVRIGFRWGGAAVGGT